MNNAVFKKVIVKVIGMTGVATLSSFLQAASFDCAKASTNIEKMICADKSLSSMDEQLSAIYQKGLESAGDKDSFKKEQRAWLKVRNACADVLCVMQSYHARINTFSAASGAVVEPIAVTNSSVVSQVENNPKRVIIFTLLEGEGYPLCKEYVEMLNKTQYTEIPTCNRRILPEFKKFSGIDWIEMTDKEVIKKIIDGRVEVLSALNPTVSSRVFSPHEEIKKIYDDEYRMFSYGISLEGDNTVDSIYKIESKNYKKNELGFCGFFSKFYVDDSFIKVESIRKYDIDPYKVFNFTGSNELFLYEGEVFVSNYVGASYYLSNLNVYGIGNKHVCKILAK